MKRRASHGTPRAHHARMSRAYLLVFVHLGLAAVICASTPSELHNAWLCLHCTGVEDPSECNAFRLCQEPMICFASSYVSPSGRVLYDMGCSDALNLAKMTFAPSPSLPAQMTLPAGSDQNRYLCDRLCFSHFCNYRLCPSYKSQTNIRCVSCTDVSHPNRCERIKTCTAHETCMYRTYINDVLEIRYAMGCMSKRICDTHEGRRRQLTIDCCDTDFCNMLSAIGVPLTSTSTTSTSDFTTVDVKTTTLTLITTTTTTLIPTITTSTTTPSTSITTTTPSTTQRIADGPLCLSCQSFSQRKGCSTLSTCRSDQMCYFSVNQSEKGLTYSAGCSSKTLCSGFGSTLIGKRSEELPRRLDPFEMKRDASLQRCFQCCDFNFCNYDLCPSILRSTPVG
ncbi:uncharacterized protein LOC124115776 [Haliotis rufescens]|uniref:uncharacterized protein LOC124115776 n=1 Tax=Haliotis rufescens TaxID=6454 RepID=UPI00201F441E|nr:uncharacterized protein LOC124115776 [Haliotis rufescens]